MQKLCQRSSETCFASYQARNKFRYSGVYTPDATDILSKYGRFSPFTLRGATGMTLSSGRFLFF